MSFFGNLSERTIKVQVKNNYGSSMVYPVCENAKMFAKLTRNKTLNLSDIEIIRKLGFTVEQVLPEKFF